MPRQAFGPNHMWSIDAHCKLEQWGIQIYGAIDVYSRYIVWCHVGIAGRTGVSVLSQYLRCLQEEGVMPEFLRSDCGAETTQTAEVHYRLSQITRADEPNLEFEDCFKYGTSKQNQRIEQFWGQLAKASLNAWRSYFYQLNADGTYKQHCMADRIAFHAVYMPIMRQVVTNFIRRHNRDQIRKQRGTDTVQGIPEVLYTHPDMSGAEHHGFAVSPSTLQPWLDELINYDMEEYLPPETQAWCEQCLRSNGFNLPLNGFERHARTQERLHKDAYLILRGSVQRHMDLVNDPPLEESYRPYADDWNSVLAAVNENTRNRPIEDDMSFLLENEVSQHAA
jgi:hypothetical protein